MLGTHCKYDIFIYNLQNSLQHPLDICICFVFFRHGAGGGAVFNFSFLFLELKD